MKKEVVTKTYGDIPLKIELDKGHFTSKNADVHAVLDLYSGEVTFKISEEDLLKARELYRNE